MAVVKEVELVIPQGATFIYEITYKDPSNNTPINLTGYTARMQMREKIDDTATIFSATTENGALFVSGSTGMVVLTIPAAITAAFQFKKVVFDIEIQSAAGVVTRLVKGTMLLDREVTR
jgi:hypothetical protein